MVYSKSTQPIIYTLSPPQQPPTILNIRQSPLKRKAEYNKKQNITQSRILRKAEYNEKQNMKVKQNNILVVSCILVAEYSGCS